MKIVILDGYSLNPGDLDWSSVAELGKTVIYDRTPDWQIAERAAGADAVLTNKCRMTSTVMDALPDLKYIGVLATGFDRVDIASARIRGIIVTNVPSYGTSAVAQCVFSHILNIMNRTSDHCRSVARGDWAKADDYCYWIYPQEELAGKTFGILGMGRIGKAAAEIGRAFGMKIIFSDPFNRDFSKDDQSVDLDFLFRHSDILSLHCPLTDDTDKIICKRNLDLMKSDAILINTGRGGLVNEEDLFHALKNESIRAAGLDVLQVEPPDAGNPLMSLENCFITPHIAWAAKAARQRLLESAAMNLKCFLSGENRNIVRE